MKDPRTIKEVVAEADAFLEAMNDKLANLTTSAVTVLLPTLMHLNHDILDRLKAKYLQKPDHLASPEETKRWFEIVGNELHDTNVAFTELKEAILPGPKFGKLSATEIDAMFAQMKDEKGN